MSTINAQNYGDGTDSVPASAVLEGTAKAWVNFNGTGTIATRDSYNTSSITDNGVGDYTVNFTDTFATGDYSMSGMGSAVTTDGRNLFEGFTARTTGAYRLLSTSGSSILTDGTYVNVSAHGDLA